MKKFLSLLFVAMLAMSAWADTTVTFIPGTHVGSNTSANAYDEITLDGVTISGTKAALAANPYRFAGGSTATITSTVGNIKKVEFTCLGSYSQGYGPDQFYGDGYTCQSGSNVGTWQGDASSFTLNTASQVRCTKIVVTIAKEVVEDLVPPVFHPDGGEFSGSLEVTLTCATENAQIAYFEGEPDGEWVGWTYYNGPFYVTETKTYTAYSYKGDEMSEFVTVTFTKVEQTVEAPVFTPASTSFTDRIEVTLACATLNAVIYYSLDNELWSVYSDPIPVTDDITIWAKAVVGDVESEVVSATYTKLVNTVDVTFDATVDKGNGSTERGEYTVVKDGVTMYVGDGTVYSDHYRIYAGDNSAFTFTSADAAIVKIEFEGVSGNPASNIQLAEGYDGTFTTSNPDGVWVGYANEVAFDVIRQARFYTITVTLASSEGPDYLFGDVNKDGVVNIGDVTALIDYLLTDVSVAPAEADVDLDGNVNIGDLTALIDYLLSSPAAPQK